MIAAKLRKLLWTIALSGAATAGVSQEATTELQTQAEAALVNGNPLQAAQLSMGILEANPDDFAALFILALAQSDLGQDALAAATAERAHNVAREDRSQFQAARLVASIRFSMGQYMRAEFWLRRAANHAKTEQDVQTVASEYRAANRANPLTLQFTASVAPSNNINDGSEDGVLNFETIGLSVLLPEDQLALSGIEFAGSARLNYRISEHDRQRTSLTGLLSGETYRLSQEAKEILASSPNEDVRAVEGTDFSTLLAEVGITHQRSGLSPLGPVSLSLNFGTYWEGPERLVNYQDLIVQHSIPIDDNDIFLIRASVRDQQALKSTLVDSMTYDLIGSYNRTLASGDQLSLSLGWRQSEAGFENTYFEYRTGIDYALNQPVFGARLSTSFEIGYRTYDTFATTLDGRDDQFVTAQTDAIFEQMSYFGFSPSMSISATRTESTAEENTSSAVQILFGIESNF